jgi:hypothetical protein
VRARGGDSDLNSERCHCLLMDSRSHIRDVGKDQDYSRSRNYVEYLLLLRGWCAGLRPPTICAKSYMAYFVSTHYYMLRLQNTELVGIMKAN